MAASGCSLPSLPPPLPKSPPEYPDLYGKRRELATVQMLEREIGFLEEELKSIRGLQPASRCCKEVADFVVGKSDPLIAINRRSRKKCRFWKWLCGIPRFSFSWICCCDGCSPHLEVPHCCECNLCNFCICDICNCLLRNKCSPPKWQCLSWPSCSCCFKVTCCPTCRLFECPRPSCPACPTRRWTCPHPKCGKVHFCASCSKSCCNSCCFCY